MAPAPTLPEGSWILVTGVNGLIGGHVARQFLQRKYKVRGTVRNLSKSKWLVDDLFAAEAANGSFELAVVEDMARANAFDEAIRGVAGVAHVASITSFDPDPNKVIPQTIAGTVNILESAAAEPSVKEFVYTSSVVAAVFPVPDVQWHIDADSWNDGAVSLAWAPPPYNPDRAVLTYVASKVEAEKALWKFVREREPHFTVNAVLPWTVLGPLLHKEQNQSTLAFVFTLFKGDTSRVSFMNAAVSVHVEDVALLHLAAILDGSVKNARLQSWSEPFNWNAVLAIFRKLYPDKAFLDDLQGQARITGTVEDSQSKTLLKTWGGRDSFIGLDESVKDTLYGKWPST